MVLSGKTALVTGASSGVGRAIAVGLSAAGIRVFGTSRNPDLVDWPSGVTGLGWTGDGQASAEALWKEAGFHEKAPDILVNNAGAGVLGEFREIDFADWEQQIELLLLSPMRLSQLALRQWDAAKPGTLVNVTSLAVEYAIPCFSGYNVAKSGLAAFSESLQLELDESVVRVLELRLGDLDTGFSSRLSSRAKGERARTVGEVLIKHEANGPQPQRVADKLLRALEAEKTGVMRIGGFFQTVLAPLFHRIVSHRLKRLVNLSYYNLGNSR